MDMSKIKNFPLAKNSIQFKAESLVLITNKGEVKELLGMPVHIKQDQVSYRQNLIVSCVRNIIRLEAEKDLLNPTDKIKIQLAESEINRLTSEIERLSIEVCKIKTAANLECQEIKDNESYLKFFGSRTGSLKGEEVKETIRTKVFYELMNMILAEDSEIFSNFIRQALMKSRTNELIAFLRPVLEDHGFKAVCDVESETI